MLSTAADFKQARDTGWYGWFYRGQLAAYPGLECREWPGLDRHGDLLQGFSARSAGYAGAPIARESFWHRAGDHRKAGPHAGSALMRSAHLLPGPLFCRGEEDTPSRRFVSPLVYFSIWREEIVVRPVRIPYQRNQKKCAHLDRHCHLRFCTLAGKTQSFKEVDPVLQTLRIKRKPGSPRSLLPSHFDTLR